MTIDQVAKIIPFRNNQKKTEFMGRTFDYTHYRLRKIENNSDEMREMGGNSENNLVLNFKERLEGALEGLP